MRRVVLAAALLAFHAGAASAQPVEASWCSVSLLDAASAAGPLAGRLRPMLGAPAHPLARVHTEHTLPHQGIYDQSIAAERDMPLMRDAALVFRSGGDVAYFNLANRLLLAWVDTYEPDFNPIDETPLDAMAQTYVLIQERMNDSDRDRARHFLRSWAHGYVERMDEARFTAKPSDIWFNNWQSHRIKLVTMFAVATDDSSLFADAKRLFWRHIQRNVHPDGSVADFDLRDALHYVVYDLEPLMQAALAAQSMGEDWFATAIPEGASLQRAMQWLRPYLDGSKQHQEFVHSKVAFDAERARAGLKGYAGSFDPHVAGPLVWLATRFDPTYQALARSLVAQPPSFVALCGQ
jgi:hypothetical protein